VFDSYNDPANHYAFYAEFPEMQHQDALTSEEPTMYSFFDEAGFYARCGADSNSESDFPDDETPQHVEATAADNFASHGFPVSGIQTGQDGRSESFPYQSSPVDNPDEEDVQHGNSNTHHSHSSSRSSNDRPAKRRRQAYRVAVETRPTVGAQFKSERRPNQHAPDTALGGNDAFHASARRRGFENIIANAERATPPPTPGPLANSVPARVSIVTPQTSPSRSPSSSRRINFTVSGPTDATLPLRFGPLQGAAYPATANQYHLGTPSEVSSTARSRDTRLSDWSKVTKSSTTTLPLAIDERPMCPYCSHEGWDGSLSSQKNSLRRHKLYKHPKHQDNRKFRCRFDECNNAKPIERKDNAKRHLRDKHNVSMLSKKDYQRKNNPHGPVDNVLKTYFERV